MKENDKILLAHGSGGQLMQKLINERILKAFGNDILNRLDDSAELKIPGSSSRLAFTTDSFVVSPIFFGGGDIGKLAVCGTVNDLSVMGARPLYLSVGFIIEEGFSFNELDRVISSMKKTAKQAGVKIVCGDTKVVNKGNCDKIFINTSGLGLLHKKARMSSSKAKPGDLIILSGTLGEHGIAILSQREGLKFDSPLKSDCAPLHELTSSLEPEFEYIRLMRDPTRGGLAAVVNEIAVSSDVGVEIYEAEVPLSGTVRAASEILGIDPLYLACEGRLVAFVAANRAEKVLRLMMKNKSGRKARIIGEVVGKHRKQVYLNTLAGSSRILDIPLQEQMPRIC